MASEDSSTTMNSQETPGDSASSGTTTPLEATTGAGNRRDEVDIALDQPTSDFKLEFLEVIDDPDGEFNVNVSGYAAPNHDHPKQPVRDLASELIKAVVDQFYEAQFQRLEAAKGPAREHDLQDYHTNDDDDSSQVF